MNENKLLQVSPGKRDAVRIEKSGETVDHSVPVLRVGPTFPVTAPRTGAACPGEGLARAAERVLAHSQPKSGRESEGSALGSASSAPALLADCPSSLVKIETNRDKTLESAENVGSASEPQLYPKGRGKHCGRFTVVGFEPKTGRTIFRRVNCKVWTCAYCGPRKAKRTKRAIREWAEALRLDKFLTLTLDPKKLTHDVSPEAYLRQVFSHFRQYLRRELGVAPHFICVVEYQKNVSGKSTVGRNGTGLPHMHILLNRKIDQRWISDVWSRLGGGQIVDIRQVGIRFVARYVSKYLTKEMLLSAPKGTRRITTSRSIRLFTKFVSEVVWELKRLPLPTFFRDFRRQEATLQKQIITDTQNDKEGYLECFEIAFMET